MKKNPAITDATRNKLIRAFCAVYEHKPISKITVKEITDLAGYNRSTFYQYFNDVFAVLEYIEDEMITTGMQRIGAISFDESDFTGQFVRNLADILREHDYYSVVICKAGVASEFFQKIKRYILPFVLERFHIAEENVTAVFAMEFYLTGMLTVLIHWLENPTIMTIDELSSLNHDIWFEGLLAQLTK